MSFMCFSVLMPAANLMPLGIIKLKVENEVFYTYLNFKFYLYKIEVTCADGKKSNGLVWSFSSCNV